MEKLQFEFVVKTQADGKSNYLAITSLTTQERKIFAVPEELQAAANHPLLIANESYTRIKNTLKKRHEKRKIWIALTDEIKKQYVDEQDNLLCDNQFLEEITSTSTVNANPQNEALIKVLEQLIENSKLNQEKTNMKKVAEKFVLEKFSGKNTNAAQWIESLEKECDRLNISHDENKIEILRFFLEKAGLDWYSSMLIKHSLHSE